MIAIRNVFPHPALSTFLMLIWLLLNNTLAPGHVVLGIVLAVCMPLLTRQFWPETGGVSSWRSVLAYLAMVIVDIVVANLSVARTTLSPGLDLRPGYLRVPLELSDDFAITILASTVSLTPGTVSVDLSPDQRFLLVHCLDLDDPAVVVADIKQRYERPLREMFSC